MKIALIFGTRPEAIKMAPVYKTLKGNNVDVKVIATAQHREMLDQVLNLFDIKPDYDLNVMTKNQTLSELTQRLIIKIDKIFQEENFDFVLVQGDTTSAFVGALVAFYHRISVGHIEAGLRTDNIYSPFPEEINRRLVSSLASVHFAPTETAKNNLLRENVSKEKIFVTGNTVIDALYWVIKNRKDDITKIKRKYGLLDKKYILMTMHRRENLGKPMIGTMKAIRRYLIENPDIFLVFPVHLNPRVREVVFNELKGVKNAILIDPVGYLEFVSLMEGCHYIMTDSGGIQEEAPALGKPVLVLRDTTERPEAIEAGTAKLIGTETTNVYNHMKLLEEELYNKMAHARNPYGDGKASKRIYSYLAKTNAVFIEEGDKN